MLDAGLKHFRSNLVFKIRNNFIFGMLYCFKVHITRFDVAGVRLCSISLTTISNLIAGSNSVEIGNGEVFKIIVTHLWLKWISESNFVCHNCGLIVSKLRLSSSSFRIFF